MWKTMGKVRYVWEGKKKGFIRDLVIFADFADVYVYKSKHKADGEWNEWVSSYWDHSVGGLPTWCL